MGSEVDPVSLTDSSASLENQRAKQALQTPSGHNPREDSKLFRAVVIGSFPSVEMVSIQLSHLTSAAGPGQSVFSFPFVREKIKTHGTLGLPV